MHYSAKKAEVCATYLNIHTDYFISASSSAIKKYLFLYKLEISNNNVKNIYKDS